MSDLKSKLPDLKELGEMTSKLFNDIKTSVAEIVDTYKQKHPQSDKSADSVNKASDDARSQEKKK